MEKSNKQIQALTEEIKALKAAPGATATKSPSAGDAYTQEEIDAQNKAEAFAEVNDDNVPEKYKNNKK